MGDVDQVLEQAQALERERDYRRACDLLAPALAQHPDDARLRRALATCTYKDPARHPGQRLDDALEILRSRPPARRALEDLPDQGSLAIAAAIYKRKWELDAHERDLLRALGLYRRAAKMGVAADDGYTAANTAFVLDLLADVEQREDPDSEVPAQRRGEADRWRQDIVDCLEPQLRRHEKHDWWPLVTIVEALIGLDRADEAQEWAKQAGALRARSTPEEGPRPWQVEATARRVAAIVRLRQDRRDRRAFRASDAAERLREILGEKWAAGAETAFEGKIGLALSGGGFRASLYHIGVLARLAELDVLRRVEVLSCVSGGSILGAYYYLKVRELIEGKTDGPPGRDDYVRLVQEVEREFLDAIRSNIRVRLLSNAASVFRMAVSRTYTRTERAGELYEQKIYSRLGDHGKWTLPDLKVHPPDEHERFNPKNDNWHRTSKVPILVLNATTMNTGHNWQYTATWMGEPPLAIHGDVDSADRLRQMYHSEAPPGYSATPLGRAVGASAAVPGLFPPIALPKLYPDLTVRLSDGGVHDNQGVTSLIEQSCSLILVSDASGQGESIVAPQDGALPILGRTMSVTMARIRESQFVDLAARRAASSLRGLMFVHLKEDLPREEIKWTDPNEPPQEPVHDEGCTVYGISRDVQRRLASVRTDLDAFHDYEAYALMASGYRMTEHYFPLGTSGFPPPGPRAEWRFCAIQDALRGGEHHEELMAKLEHSNKLFFKWTPWPGAMMKLAIVLVLALVAGGIAAAWLIGGAVAAAVALGVLLVAVIACAAPDEKWWVHYPSLFVKVPLGVLAALAGPALAWPYLRTLNRRYLKGGRLPPGACVWEDAPTAQPPVTEPATAR